ncbi:ead/Ea22-like family protein [Pseudomonas typographi]|uniref:ead/Ea22-like family protein n=1 Tax=Pseudomonas typographi TaxID=2715964 RepID=UPI001682F68D|nr:ead/Ea22-like family protein [Pseudomonas typographi]MBD1554687.1 hypothetical protein [Pseudomonas typographi]
MTIDYAELKRLAEAAQGRNWRAGNFYGKAFIPAYQVIAETDEGACVILEGNKNFLPEAKANIAFVAAANPAAILALIAENESANARLHEVAVACATAEQERDRLRDTLALMSSEDLKWAGLREQEAEINHLKAENEALRRAVDQLRGSFKNFHRSLSARFGYCHDEKDWFRDQISLEEHIASERRQLRAENEGLRKDAERYRWLRGRVPGSAYRVAGVIYSEGGDGVDAAIDAAMSKDAGHG